MKNGTECMDFLEQAAQSLKQAVGMNTAEAQAKAKEASGDMSGKAQEMAGAAKGKAAELQGEAKGKAEELKKKM